MERKTPPALWIGVAALAAVPMIAATRFFFPGQTSHTGTDGTRVQQL